MLALTLAASSLCLSVSWCPWSICCVWGERLARGEQASDVSYPDPGLFPRHSGPRVGCLCLIVPQHPGSGSPRTPLFTPSDFAITPDSPRTQHSPHSPLLFPAPPQSPLPPGSLPGLPRFFTRSRPQRCLPIAPSRFTFLLPSPGQRTRPVLPHRSLCCLHPNFPRRLSLSLAPHKHGLIMVPECQPSPSHLRDCAPSFCGTKSPSKRYVCSKLLAPPGPNDFLVQNKHSENVCRTPVDAPRQMSRGLRTRMTGGERS